MPSPPNHRWAKWTQRIHLYLGLYLLLFLWLFAGSGLVLNHAWDFTEFWSRRKQTTRDEHFAIPNAGSDVGRAEELMQQLGLAGELEWTATRPAADRLEFRVARPGRTIDVKADFAKQTAAVQEIRVNGWGAFRALHTFNGTRLNAPRAERDWLLTKLWTWSMDAVAAGMLLLVLTSVFLAYERREKWLGAGLSLALGLGLCGFFVFGLRWL